MTKYVNVVKIKTSDFLRSCFQEHYISVNLGLALFELRKLLELFRLLFRTFRDRALSIRVRICMGMQGLPLGAIQQAGSSGPGAPPAYIQSGGIT